MAEEVARSKRLIANVERERLIETILEILPQGHGSGLDADMVDGLHAVEILSKAVSRAAGGGGGGVGGNGAEVKKESHIIFVAVAQEVTI